MPIPHRQEPRADRGGSTFVGGVIGTEAAPDPPQPLTPALVRERHQT
jgi:hypothetical protein